MYTLQFWKYALERAVKTAAQALILLWSGHEIFDVFDHFDWQTALGIAIGGFVLSMLTSLVSAPVATKGTASMLSEVEYKEAA